MCIRDSTKTEKFTFKKYDPVVKKMCIRDSSYVVYAVVPAIGLANLILDMLDKNVLFD